MLRFLGTDCETGGLTDDTSLLTAYLVALDSKFNPIDDLYLRVKPLDGIYKCTAEALKINGINLIEHDKIAEYPEICMQKMLDFVEMHSGNGKDKLVPVGHNVSWDIRRYKNQIMRRPTQLDRFIDYRSIDTCSVARFLQLTKKLPPRMWISLDALAQYFKIPKPEIHDAKVDTLTAVQVLQEFIKLVNPTLSPEDLAFILSMDPNGDANDKA